MGNDILLYFVYGFGDGSYVRSLLGQTANVVKIVVYEPDTDAFIQKYDEEILGEMLSDGRLTLVLKEDENPDELEQVLDGLIEPYNAAHISAIILTEYRECYADEYSDIIGMLKRIINERLSGCAGMRLHAELPCKNELYALSVLADNYGCDKLFKAFEDKDMPVIIVAAGPSLDKNIFELKRAEKKALIIAASRCASRFDREGIHADLIAQLDPKSDGFLDHDTERKHMILISSRGDLEIQKKYRGRCIYYDFSDNLTGEGRVLDMPVSEERGGSVTTYVFSLFLEAGYRRIILVGQDLAFGEKNETHAGNDNRNVGTTEGDAMVPGVNGKPVKTRHDWIAFLEQFEKLIKDHPEADVIDATEGGALIRGSRLMSLKDAIDRYCINEYPITEKLENLPKLKTREEESKVFACIKAAVETIPEIEEKIDRFIRIGERILDERYKVTGSDLRRYDSLYHEILESRIGNILTYYCEDIMQEYIKNAVCFEASGEEHAKVRTELETFERLKKAIPELEKYIRSIYV